MKLPFNTKPTSHLSRGSALRMGGAGSIAEAMAGKPRATGLARYTAKRATACASCTKGKHVCTSIHCPCPRCNPEIRV